MLVYVVLYIWFIALYAVTLFNESRIYNKNGSVRGPEYYRKRYVIFTFGAIILMLGLRAEFMGEDLLKGLNPGYLPTFEDIAAHPWSDVLGGKTWYNYERGYTIFNKVVGIFSTNHQVFLFICALISVAPIAYVIYKHSYNLFLSVIVFMGLPTFVVEFSTLRQAIAMSITFLALHFVIEHKPWIFVILILLASTFHGSAILCLLCYPVFYYRNTRKSIIVNIFILAAIFVLRKPLYYAFCMIAYGSVTTDDAGAINLLIFFVAIYLFCALFMDIDNKMSNGFLNLFWFSCVFQIISNVFMEVTRQGYYFNLALIILLPEVFKDMKRSTKPWVRYLSMTLLVLFFIAFGYFELATTEWSVSNPYYFFFNAPKIH